MFIFINYKQNVEPDHSVAKKLEKNLKDAQHIVFRDETDVKAGDVWPKKILANLKKCDVMVSLVSNASLKSRWVLNEIDGAIEMGKRLIPIILETINKDINFTDYRPRFTNLQHITFTGNIDLLTQNLLADLKTKPKYLYQELVFGVLQKNNISDPSEIICALLLMLKDFHIIPAALVDLGQNNGFPKVVGDGHTRSLAESLADLTIEVASVQKHNAKNSIKHNKLMQAKSLEYLSKRTICLATILSSAIKDWAPEVEQAKKTIKSNFKKR